MNRCLCCGKPLRSPAEEKNGWHQACITGFFGTKEMPEISMTDEMLNRIVLDSVSKGLTVPGVQKKMSVHLSTEGNPRLTIVNYPAGYILKPQADEYRNLPELEYLIMQMAKKTGIRIVPCGLIKTESPGDKYAYIARRIDRERGQILAMEDFCQLDERLTEDKYRGSYERCGKIIQKYSVNPGLDLSEMFLRLVFSFAVGNSDMHLKNFSLIETKEGSKEYILSDAYDLLSTNIVIPEDNEQMALTLNGKKTKIRYTDFMMLAENTGITEKAAKKLIDTVVKKKLDYITMCRESYLPEDMKGSLIELIERRMESVV